MAFTNLSGSFSHVAELPDQPNVQDGFTPQTLKATFDLAGQEIKSFLNNVHLSELQASASGSSGAESIGSAAAHGIAAGTVHAQICALKDLHDGYRRDFDEAVNGAIPANTILFSKLDSQTQAKIQSGVTAGFHLSAYTTAGTYSFTAPKTGLYRVRMCGAGSAGDCWNEVFYNTQNLMTNTVYPGRGGASGAALETFLALSAGDSFPITVGAGAENSICVDAVTDIVAYHENETYLSVGGTTTLGSTEGAFLFSCAGGNNAGLRVTANTNGYNAYPVLSKSGGFEPFRSVFSYDCYKTKHNTAGADSAFGSGGDNTGAPNYTAYSPSLGGGGSAGFIHLYGGNFFLRAAPGRGADGAVFLEYISGEEISA